MTKIKNLTSYEDIISAIEFHLQKEELSSVEELCTSALKSFPNDFTLNYCAALVAFEQSQGDKALQFAFHALEILKANLDKIHNTDHINTIGVIFKEHKNFNVAISCFQIALDKKPDFYECNFNMAHTYVLTKDYTQALKWFLKAKEISPTFHVLNMIGDVYFQQQKINAALDYFKEAEKSSPNDPMAVYNIALSLESKGLVKEAEQYLHRAADLAPDSYLILYALSNVIKFDINNKEHNIYIEKIRGFLKNPNLEDLWACRFNFVLGQMHHDTKDYDSAFKHYVIANQYKSKLETPLNLDAYTNYHNSLKTIYTAAFLKKKHLYGNKTTLPIFIVGMPRSGTSLTEQIIACHSKVYGAGETPYLPDVIGTIKPRKIPGYISPVTGYPEIVPQLSKEEIHSLSEDYLKRIRPDKSGNVKIIDKMPDNFSNIGFIKLLYPNATIIHCKRHPLDIFLSIFFTDFVNIGYSNDIGIITQYYKLYDNLMKHWYAQFPGKIYNSYYEELVYKQEEKSRELIKLCGLKWEDACLNFHNSEKPVFTASLLQVKEPMYKKSIFRWKNYDKQLGAVKAALKHEIAEYEAEIIKRVPELKDML